MKPLIIPAVLADNAKDALDKIRLIENAAPWIQIDVLDGTLIPSMSWHDARDLQNVELKASIELHLMVDHPKRVIDEWRGIQSLKRVTWHVEAPIDHAALIMACRAHGLEVGLAISPQTPLDRLEPYLSKLDTALILGVDPGQSGQELLPAMIERVADLHAIAPSLPLGFDGGVRSESFRKLAEAGVSYFYMASAIFSDNDPASLLNTQQTLLDSIAIPS